MEIAWRPFQKAEADMEYMEKRLRLEFLTSAPENGAAEENPVKLLENLSAIKVRHAALCTQVQEIAAEQKQSMDSIRAHLDTTVQLVQQLQQTADVEIPPLTKMEQESADFLGLSVNQNTAEVRSFRGTPSYVHCFLIVQFYVSCHSEKYKA
uniref:Protein FAM33A n=1 Tax=Oncorhynchus tshawytscha TaxID=74940 RepID=A0AAZ3QBK4_ONCTS